MEPRAVFMAYPTWCAVQEWHDQSSSKLIAEAAFWWNREWWAEKWFCVATSLYDVLEKGGKTSVTKLNQLVLPRSKSRHVFCSWDWFCHWKGRPYASVSSFCIEELYIRPSRNRECLFWYDWIYTSRGESGTIRGIRGTWVQCQSGNCWMSPKFAYRRSIDRRNTNKRTLRQVCTSIPSFQVTSHHITSLSHHITITSHYRKLISTICHSS